MTDPKPGSRTSDHISSGGSRDGNGYLRNSDNTPSTSYGEQLIDHHGTVESRNEVEQRRANAIRSNSSNPST